MNAHVNHQRTVFPLILLSLLGGAGGGAAEPVDLATSPVAILRQVPALLGEDGQPDQDAIAALLAGIDADVQQRLLVPAEQPAPADPLQGGGWRLWVFWAMDLPQIDGLAAALGTAERATGVAIQARHLASLRHWEAFLFHHNDRRETALAAIQGGEQIAIDSSITRWLAEVEPARAMLTAYHGGRVPLWSRTAEATFFRVQALPCFRLVSPAGRIHRLQGFAEGTDLAAWIRGCQRFEAERTDALLRLEAP